MDCNQAISEFQRLLTLISPSSSKDFINWLRNNIKRMQEKIEEQFNEDNADVILNSIRDDIRSDLPVNAVSPTENIIIPSHGPNSDCKSETMVHVDGFLYDDEIIEELCEQGKMSMEYCTECGSRNIKPLTFITHSASAKQIKYIYKYLLPDLRGRTVVDVGSRTGALLFGGYLYSGASGIIGIEIDPTFCQLQQKILINYGMEDRVKIIHQDVQNCPEILHSADVVILNNVFEFFMTREAQIIIWQFIQQTVKKPGTLLVTVPSIQSTLETLQINVDVSSWLKPVDVGNLCKKANLILFGDEEQDEKTLESIHLYEVLKSAL